MKEEEDEEEEEEEEANDLCNFVQKKLECVDNSTNNCNERGKIFNPRKNNYLRIAIFVRKFSLGINAF